MRTATILFLLLATMFAVAAPPAPARVHLYRLQGPGLFMGTLTFRDGKKTIAKLKEGESTTIELPAGPHILRIKGHHQIVGVDLKPGEDVYVKALLAFHHVDFARVPKDEGEIEIRETKPH